jgi:dolichyl-phosphate beta-glucosyltransferase
MDISIIIPVFEESHKIARDIEAASAFLQHQNLTGEIIVIDDGSSDNTVSAAQGTAVAAWATLIVKGYTPHRGKGYAVRTGIGLAQGQYIMFADSGCCVPYDNILQGLDMLKAKSCDIAHGSRKLRQSHIAKPQSRYRRCCSYLFRRMAVCIAKIPAELTDSQCGFKIYPGHIAHQLYGQCVTDGPMFDIEIILLAQKLGYRIKEFPIQWSCDRDSRVSPARNLRQVLGELIAIKRIPRPK